MKIMSQFVWDYPVCDQKTKRIHIYMNEYDVTPKYKGTQRQIAVSLEDVTANKEYGFILPAIQYIAP